MLFLPQFRGANRAALEAGFVNHLLWSEDLTQSVWTKAQCSISANAALAPDGTMTADKIVENSATANHAVQQSLTGLSGGVLLSTHAKAAGRDIVGLFWGTGQIFFGAFYLSGDGWVVQNCALPAGPEVPAGILALPNDWYRVWIRVPDASAASAFCIAPVARTSSVGNPVFNTYTGDGSSGIYVWGSQLEPA